MLLLPSSAPLARTVERVATSFGLVVAPEWVPGRVAFGSIADADELDDVFDPSIDRASLGEALRAAHVPSSAAPLLASALVDREGVLDLATPGAPPSATRPPTLFEMHALEDVLADLARLLPPARVRIERTLNASGLNHCTIVGRDARIRLLATNGTTLAGRTHALVHELGHALIGVARVDGLDYRAPYGSVDYGPFLRPSTFEAICDEEALVRALADAWLLRRRAVTWARTWPGAIDEAGRDLDGDDLAAFVRFRLAQGLGRPYEPVVVRRV